MAFTYNELTAITHNLIVNELADGVFKSSEFTNRIREKQVLEDGGAQIQVPLMSVDDTGSNGQFYVKGTALNLNTYDALTSSVHDWKYMEETVVVDQIDVAKNAGKSGQLKLVGSKVKIAEKAMKQRFIKAVIQGTGNEFIGLDTIIATSGTYGGIAPADLAAWVATVLDNSGTGRALTLDLLNQAVDSSTESGIGGPTLGIMKNSVFTVFKGLLDANQRTTRESSLGGQGHKGQSLVYMGIDHLVENNMPNTAGGDGQVFYIDEEAVKLHVHKDHNMRVQSVSALETKDGLLERIFLYAAYIAHNRRFNARVTDINI